MYVDYSGGAATYSAPPYAVRTEVEPYGAAKLFGVTMYFALGRSLFEVVP